jgi:hypothetical protein
MEPNRFDDVEVRIVEEPVAAAPKPRSQRRLGHAALAVTAAVTLAGSLAAGASALTSTAPAPTRAPAPAQRHHGWGGHHGLCHRGEGNRGSSSAAAPNF